MASSNSRSTQDLVKKMLILSFQKSTGNSKELEMSLRKSYFMNYIRASVGNSLQYLVCLKSERVWIDSVLKIFKCKLTFGLKYRYIAKLA